MTPEVKTRTSACSRPRLSAFPGLLPRRWLLPVRLGHSCHQLQLQGSLGREAQSFPGCMRAAFSLIYSQDGRKQRKGKHTAGASTSAPPPPPPHHPGLSHLRRFCGVWSSANRRRGVCESEWHPGVSLGSLQLWVQWVLRLPVTEPGLEKGMP